MPSSYRDERSNAQTDEDVRPSCGEIFDQQRGDLGQIQHVHQVFDTLQFINTQIERLSSTREKTDLLKFRSIQCLSIGIQNGLGSAITIRRL